MPKISFQGRRVPLPRNRLLRIGLGVILIVFGFLGFLPVLGFWMVPLGLAVLSVDFAIARRARRKSEVAIVRWWRNWRARRRAHAANQYAAPREHDRPEGSDPLRR